MFTCKDRRWYSRKRSCKNPRTNLALFFSALNRPEYLADKAAYRRQCAAPFRLSVAASADEGVQAARPRRDREQQVARVEDCREARLHTKIWQCFGKIRLSLPRVSNLQNLAECWQFWRARSRLYRSQFANQKTTTRSLYRMFQALQELRT